MAIWYAVINSTTGEAVSYGTEIANPLPTGLAAIPIDHMPGERERWDPVSRKVVARPSTATEQKRERLAVLRAKGWGNLTVQEQAEANSLKFDLGL